MSVLGRPPVISADENLRIMEKMFQSGIKPNVIGAKMGIDGKLVSDILSGRKCNRAQGYDTRPRKTFAPGERERLVKDLLKGMLTIDLMQKYNVYRKTIDTARRGRVAPWVQVHINVKNESTIPV